MFYENVLLAIIHILTECFIKQIFFSFKMSSKFVGKATK